MTRRKNGRAPGHGSPVSPPQADLVPSAVWRISNELVVALDNAFGDPTDAYVNGSQVWLRDEDALGVTIEWRLHPVAGFVRPKGVETAELFTRVAAALHVGSPLPAAVDELWDGVECFPAFGEQVRVDAMAARGAELLGRRPDGVGVVDHAPIGDRWERSQRRTSIVSELIDALASAHD